MLDLGNWFFNSLRTSGRLMQIYQPVCQKRLSDSIPPHRQSRRRLRNQLAELAQQPEEDEEDSSNTSQIWLSAGFESIVMEKSLPEEVQTSFKRLEKLSMDSKTMKLMNKGFVLEGSERYETILGGLKSIGLKIEKLKEERLEDELVRERSQWPSRKFGEWETF
jgi:hypothetical protein